MAFLFGYFAIATASHISSTSPSISLLTDPAKRNSPPYFLTKFITSDEYILYASLPVKLVSRPSSYLAFFLNFNKLTIEIGPKSGFSKNPLICSSLGKILFSTFI